MTLASAKINSTCTLENNLDLREQNRNILEPFEGKRWIFMRLVMIFLDLLQQNDFFMLAIKKEILA